MSFQRVRRRAFIAALGCAAAWPIVARAQQSAIPVVGFIRSTSSQDSAQLVAAFRRGLGETGFIEGENLAVEYRWADNQLDQLPTLAADLVRRQVAVIVATGGAFTGLAAKAATSSIPIVFSTGGDPVSQGLVASLNRPGGNITGVTMFTSAIVAKRLELLRELIPSVDAIGFLVNTKSAVVEGEMKEVREAARILGLQLLVVNASDEREIDAAFALLGERQIGALLIMADPFLDSRRDQIVSLAARYTIPAMSVWRDYPAAGGLISYGASLTDSYRQIGIYVGRILKGDAPANLPVVQPTKFELVINLKTAKALKLTVPQTLQGAADEVIE
jgi:putative tryptophan/tyrosine transport system substrate-binding protein